MMQWVWIWLFLALLVAGLYGFVWRRRSQRLRLKIEPIPDKRLDNSPEPNEIIGSVRVRPRDADATAATPAPPPAKPAPKKKSLNDETTAASPPAAETPDPLVEDLFPDAPVTPSVVRQARIYTVHVVANHSGFLGRDLLGSLLQYGLRFGEMSIFHRHEQPSGQGEVMFSVARAVEPGTFDLDDMERQLIPGVTCFIQLPLPNALAAFDLMVDTARRLADDLDGCVLDSSSQPVSAEQLARWRDEIAQADDA